MTIRVLPQALTVCKVDNLSEIDLSCPLYFIGRTDEELSVVCETEHAPIKTIAREDGWRGFRIEGTLDFSLVGILSKLSGLLASAGIGLFAISTFNTDYILVKRENLEHALKLLSENGYDIE